MSVLFGVDGTDNTTVKTARSQNGDQSLSRLKEFDPYIVPVISTYFNGYNISRLILHDVEGVPIA